MKEGKYTVRWNRGRQIDDAAEQASEQYDTLRSAKRKADDIEAELGTIPSLFRDGVEINRAGGAR